MEFINRNRELSVLSRISPGLSIVFGRRRIGKTALIQHWSKDKSLYYSQAIEGAPSLQISQLLIDLAGLLPEGINPKDWPEFFSALALAPENTTLVIDEFPYLVNSSKELPSLLQKWLDHNIPKGFRLILLGSSQTMMHGTFLDSHSPLYERAQEIIQLAPLSYEHFCSAVNLAIDNVQSFELFSLVGGVPKYWEFIQKGESPSQLADRIFFQNSARLESEPDRLLKDENIAGIQAKSIFEAIGRGAHRPSEIAARLEVKQSSLSTAFQLLRQASLIEREVPFGVAAKNSKLSLYQISDFALRFWYKVFSPHRTRWSLYDEKKKNSLIHEHAAFVLEDSFRALYSDAARYWEGKSIEIDAVRFDRADLSSVIITEIKHIELSPSERKITEEKLKQKFKHSKLAKRFALQEVEVLDTAAVLEQLAKLERS